LIKAYAADSDKSGYLVVLKASALDARANGGVSCLYHYA
jgi:hypothetical protein